MKNSAKFAILTISILLVFSITLALCISGIGSHKGADHSYDMGDTGFMSVIGGISHRNILIPTALQLISYCIIISIPKEAGSLRL